MRYYLRAMKPIYSSFLSCEKDMYQFVKLLFVNSKPYSDKLKSLLIINKPDCLQAAIEEQDNKYQDLIDSKPLCVMPKEGYIRLNPKIARKEFQNIKSYILVTFDNFSPNRDEPKFMDCTVNFDIICYNDEWDLDGFRERPIAEYIDGILNSISNQYKNLQTRPAGNNIKLSGMGEYAFLGCNLAVLNEDISMYTLSYRAIHFTEDKKLEAIFE